MSAKKTHNYNATRPLPSCTTRQDASMLFACNTETELNHTVLLPLCCLVSTLASTYCSGCKCDPPHSSFVVMCSGLAGWRGWMDPSSVVVINMLLFKLRILNLFIKWRNKMFYLLALMFFVYLDKEKREMTHSTSWLRETPFFLLS